MRTLWVAALAVVAVFAPGCSDECETVNCSPCPRFGDLKVSDATTGAAIPGVTVVGGDVSWSCAESAGVTRCSTAPYNLPDAAVAVTVSAAGYVSREVQLSPVQGPSNGCCPACITYSPDALTLTPVP